VTSWLVVVVEMTNTLKQAEQELANAIKSDFGSDAFIVNHPSFGGIETAIAFRKGEWLKAAAFFSESVFGKIEVLENAAIVRY